MYSKRLRAFELLQEQDPDVVVADLNISSEELFLAFPEKVRAYLDDHVGEDIDDDETEGY